MAITELIFPVFKPEVAETAYQTVCAISRSLEKIDGVIVRRFGHILKQNGTDVSHEYRAVLALEWQSAENFHNFYPASPQFHEFVTQVVPHVAGKATPTLFDPREPLARSKSSLGSEVTQILTGKILGSKEDVHVAWDAYVAALNKEKADVATWCGWGLEHGDGTFVGLAGFKDVDEIDALGSKADAISDAYKKVKATIDPEDLTVRFGA